MSQPRFSLRGVLDVVGFVAVASRAQMYRRCIADTGTAILRPHVWPDDGCAVLLVPVTQRLGQESGACSLGGKLSRRRALYAASAFISA
jgi:hypothetical protein